MKDKKNHKNIVVRLYYDYDLELIEHLDKQRSISQYIRALIAKDIEKTKKEQ